MKRFFLTFLCCLLLPGVAWAHPGGLDASQGHRDRNNVSGLGSYHYHCDHTAAHLHIWDLCPYSPEYQVYKETKARMGELVQCYRDTPDQFDAAKEGELRALLCRDVMPFRLTEAALSGEGVAFAVTTNKGVNIRKKMSASSTQRGAIPVTGSPVLLTGPAAEGWCPVQYWHQGAVTRGYVMEKCLSAVPLTEYARLLWEAL